MTKAKDTTLLNDPDEIISVVEAMLYAADTPQPAGDLLHVIEKIVPGRGGGSGTALDTTAIEKACMALGDRLDQAGSALQVLEVAGGFRLATRPRYDHCIRTMRQVQKPSQLSLQALETLAVVAYRQPVTTAEIAAVRGVDPSGSLRTLREVGLVRITGRKRAVGRPFTYGTTKQFLEVFGLRDIEELPSPDEFEELLEG
jgi:segregation and condensation protein B